MHQEQGVLGGDVSFVERLTDEKVLAKTQELGHFDRWKAVVLRRLQEKVPRSARSLSLSLYLSLAVSLPPCPALSLDSRLVLSRGMWCLVWGMEGGNRERERERESKKEREQERERAREQQTRAAPRRA